MRCGKQLLEGRRGGEEEEGEERWVTAFLCLCPTGGWPRWEGSEAAQLC